ncbi:hypothetical protein OE88DRAFT_575211 [Heliocybe sulcata]|uniref:Uncharacterized protein n=1 Tax=Heliocybe sulcata TaxID=5364 RepID=A0A5C3MVW7_9AGAM|nr:hypothetical protein OE88DRAFT_575211 [Heliocybe sulcata]
MSVFSSWALSSLGSKQALGEAFSTDVGCEYCKSEGKRNSRYRRTPSSTGKRRRGESVGQRKLSVYLPEFHWLADCMGKSATRSFQVLYSFLATIR